MKSTRKFKAIYFPQKNEDGINIVKNISISFNTIEEKNLYKRIEKISSTEIKHIVAIYSYNQLLKAASDENRKITEFIKLRLKEHFFNRKSIIKKTINVNKPKIKEWLKNLETNNKSQDAEVAVSEIKKFLKQLIN